MPRYYSIKMNGMLTVPDDADIDSKSIADMLIEYAESFKGELGASYTIQECDEVGYPKPPSKPDASKRHWRSRGQIGDGRHADSY